MRGAVRVPGDKSISHRAVLFAALAEGASAIRGWLPAGDTQAMLEAVQALGVAVTPTRQTAQAWDLRVEGRGLHGLQAPVAPLDCRNAGTALRLLAGVLAGQRFASTLDGSPQLRRRPMRRIIDPLRAMGAAIADDDGRAPLRLQPAPLRGIDYPLPVASAQVKSAILLAGLYADGATAVHEPGPARDHTERLLQAMGAKLTVNGPTIRLAAGARRLAPLALAVPGDISSAAFPLVAAAIVPEADVQVQQVGLNETRTGIVSLLQAMGSDLAPANEQYSGGEPLGDLRLKAAPLTAVAVAGPVVVRAIDELPVWAVAATQAAGVSTLHDAGELRVKEVDRIAVLAGELRRLGARVFELDDGMRVEGGVPLRGAAVDSHGDHRMAMALAVAALVADGPTTIADAGCIDDSFPAFVSTMRALGATMEWLP